MIRLKNFIFLALFLNYHSQAKGQQDSMSLEYSKIHDLLNSDMSLLLRDSPAVDIFTSGLGDFPMRVSTVEKSAKSIMGGSGTLIYYQGSLVKGIAFLSNTNMLYVKVKGKVPDEFIYYYNSKNFTDTVNMRQQIRLVLENKYKFSISDIEDTCDVWKVQKIDTTKLVRYNPEKHGMDFGSGPDETGKNLLCIGFPLSFLYRSIEQKAKIVVSGDSFDDNWDNRYHFDNIPYALMSNLGELNKLLEERYGIKFIKTKMLQKLKLIEFEE